MIQIFQAEELFTSVRKCAKIKREFFLCGVNGFESGAGGETQKFAG